MSAQFVKRNRTRFPDHLLREAHGLGALRRAAADTGIDVPDVIHVDLTTLVMPLIASVPGSVTHWRKLGQGLAAIHAKQTPQPRYDGDVRRLSRGILCGLSGAAA